ncbi:MAG: hypothetical protein ACNA8W_14740 [Bradymonadaceae bacterium]
MKRKFLLIFVTVALVLLTVGCKERECREMMRCCEAAAEIDGVGHTCGPMAANVRDPTTCRTIMRTLRYMLEDKGRPVPQECGGDE